MIRLPPRFTPTDTRFPYTTPYRSDFARVQQCARGFLPADHDMFKPGRETVAGIIAHRTMLGRGAECVGNPLRGPRVIGREGDTDLAIFEYGVVLAIGLLDPVEALGDRWEERWVGKEWVSKCRTRWTRII